MGKSRLATRKRIIAALNSSIPDDSTHRILITPRCSDLGRKVLVLASLSKKYVQIQLTNRKGERSVQTVRRTRLETIGHFLNRGGRIVTELPTS